MSMADNLFNINDFVKVAVESLYFTVIVDNNGIIRYLSDNYADILNIDTKKAEGMPVEKVIPNTRLDIVAKTGRAEIGHIFRLKNGQDVICNRIPFKDENGNVKGVISTASFYDINKVETLNQQILQLKKENKLYIEQLNNLRNSTFSVQNIIGQSNKILEIKSILPKISHSNLSVLITGETGTGKEVFANAIHQLSDRKIFNYIKINCAAIPKDLLESELFGYEEGAFSGAAKGGKKGKFELADHGTILLDEIGEMPLFLQSKLLRVIQEQELERVGGLKTIPIDVRVVCCTNKNLEKLVSEGTFREDLYYRINVVEMNIPPLRDRIDDIPLLCDYFLQKFNKESGYCINGISDDVFQLFEQYNWKGNVRELEHVIERACVMSSGSTLTINDFDFFLPRVFKENTISDIVGSKEITSLEEQKNQFEKEAIIKALIHTKGNKTSAAKLLKIDRSILYDKLKRYNISL
jgi:transcriptional regulator with PAS, ATPase and Fis domain